MTANNERAAAIRWIQDQMADYGLTIEDLNAAGCFDQPPPPPPPAVCYRNAQGMSWDGQGEMPDWLRRAVNAGQSMEFFRLG
ncbi:H-NS histone family protein [Cupriavidus sp. TMH.W2]|uniref:H-NS histone family protein n=1 Tax=Cupriavidus sp. TMH.W2 TaxID=3434465 RepID=UPI003D78318D